MSDIGTHPQEQIEGMDNNGVIISSDPVSIIDCGTPEVLEKDQMGIQKIEQITFI